MATPISPICRVATWHPSMLQRHLIAVAIDGALLLMPIPLVVHVVIALALDAAFRLLWRVRRHA